VVPRPLDVDGAIATIRTLLAARAHARWYDVIRPSAESWEVLSALLALLELARRGELRLRQATPFGSMVITRESAGQAA
jgi:segregation and condensation protein A